MSEHWAKSIFRIQHHTQKKAPKSNASMLVFQILCGKPDVNITAYVLHVHKQEHQPITMTRTEQ